MLAISPAEADLMKLLTISLQVFLAGIKDQVFNQIQMVQMAAWPLSEPPNLAVED